MHFVHINKLPIRLGQFLKLANIVQDGIEAKFYIQEGQVLVNGKIETRRGRQLVVDDVVVFNAESYKVCN